MTKWFMAKEITYEETRLEDQLGELLGDRLRLVDGGASTLIPLANLPFPSIQALPDVYSNFRTSIEKKYPEIVGKSLEPLKTIPPLPKTIQIQSDSLQDFEPRFERDSRSSFPFTVKNYDIQIHFLYICTYIGRGTFCLEKTG